MPRSQVSRGEDVEDEDLVWRMYQVSGLLGEDVEEEDLDTVLSNNICLLVWNCLCGAWRSALGAWRSALGAWWIGVLVSGL